MGTKVENSEQKRINKLFKESFKKKLVQQIESKSITLKQARLRCGVSNSVLLDWKSIYGQEAFMKKKAQREKSRQQTEEHKERSKFWKELEQAKLKAQMYESMIDMAKSKYGIDLKKNYGLK
jgi:hypothetical protein